MGEAARKVSDSFKSSHIRVSWAELIQLRNFYIHAYHLVDIGRLWQTVHGVISETERKVSAILPEDPEP